MTIDRDQITKDLMRAARGLSANTMARVVNSYTIGISWYGCSKSRIAEGVARDIDVERTRAMGDNRTRYTWRETFYAKLRHELANEKRPPSKKERDAKKESKLAALKHERDVEADEFLDKGNDFSDLSGFIVAAENGIREAQIKLNKAADQRDRLFRIRRTLEHRSR